MTIPRPVAPETPECDNLAALMGNVDAITEFIEWAGEHGFQLGQFAPVDGYRDEQFMPVGRSTHELALESLGLDVKKLETERRALLDYQRRLNVWADQ